MSDLAKQIRLVRKEMGLSQANFGAKLGVTGSAVQQWELRRATPYPKTLKKIAEVSGKPLSWFTQGAEQVRQPLAPEYASTPWLEQGSRVDMQAWWSFVASLGWDDKQLATATQTDLGTVIRWKTGDEVPPLAAVLAVARSGGANERMFLVQMTEPRLASSDVSQALRELKAVRESLQEAQTRVAAAEGILRAFQT